MMGCGPSSKVTDLQMATRRDTGCDERTKASNQREEHKQERLLRVSCQRRPNASPVSLCVSQLRAWYFCPWLRALLHFPLLPLLPTTPPPHPGAPAWIAGNGELVSKHGGTRDDSQQGRRGHAATRTECRETMRPPELN